jgi:hypothetical protein
MLSLVVSAVLTLAVADVPAPVTAQLVRDASESGRARVDITLRRSDISEVFVEALDENGVTVDTYTLHPRDKDVFRARMSVRFALDVEAKIRSAKVSAFTVESAAAKTPAFDLFLSKALPMVGCPQADPNFCDPTRNECNLICAMMGCTNAVYSCIDEGGGCVASCSCNLCP